MLDIKFCLIGHNYKKGCSSLNVVKGDTSSAMRTLHNYHQVWLQYGFTPEFYYIPQNEAGTNRESYPLRPELIESIMYLYRATADPYLLQAGEDILRSIQHSAKTPCGYATIRDVRDHRKEDRMESFFLSETTKYLYLLFDTDNFIHNQGQSGTVINTPNGECIVDAGGYIFNTEAHPIDSSALHCCYNVPKQHLFNFAELQANKNIFRGETIESRKSFIPKNNCSTLNNDDVIVEENDSTNKTTKESDVLINVGEITTESSNTYVKLEDNDNVSYKINMADNSDDNSNNTLFREHVEDKVEVALIDQILPVKQEKVFDAQEMLERFRLENKYPKNSTWENNYKILTCKAQPFLQRISILGEFFHNN